MSEKVKVKLTESFVNVGEKGDEVEVYPNEARQMAVLGRIEGDLKDYAPDVEGQEHYVLTDQRREADQRGGSGYGESAQLEVDDEGRTVAAGDLSDDDKKSSGKSKSSKKG